MPLIVWCFHKSLKIKWVFCSCPLWSIHESINNKFQNQTLMMMMNCFCGMVDWRKAFSHISSRDYCQRSSPSRISDTPRAGFEPKQNLSSGLVEWSCAVVITTTPRRHIDNHYTSSGKMQCIKNWNKFKKYVPKLNHGKLLHVKVISLLTWRMLQTYR